MADATTGSINACFPISLLEESDSDVESTCCNDVESEMMVVSRSMCDAFAKDGFIVFPHVFDLSTVEALNVRLEEVLRGRYDRGAAPDKAPRRVRGDLKIDSSIAKTQNEKQHANKIFQPTTKTTTSSSLSEEEEEDKSLKQKNKSKNSVSPKQASQSRVGRTRVGPLGFSGNLCNVKVLQIINVHKADYLFRSLATHVLLGKVVAELAGWTEHGARLAQDQVWAKPPGAAALVYHRDSPYFMFTPAEVITVWVALDDMDEEIGPLNYVRGSHLWGGDCRSGSAKRFFSSNGGLDLLRSAAEQAGVTEWELVSMAGLKAGGISIHDGRTWHGSGKNQSSCRPRRGVGLHFVPAQARFTRDAENSSLWKSYVENVEDPAKLELPEEDFPITWRPASSSTNTP